MNKIKFCLIVPSLQVGGMERVMSELACFLCARQQYEVHLVLYGISRDIFYNIPINLVVHRPGFNFNNKKRTWYTFKTLNYLRKEIKRINPNTILSFGEIWNNFVLIATLGLGYPVYISDRCQPNKSLGWIHDFLRKILYKRVDGVICQTETAKLIYQKMIGTSKIFVIGNPIREILPSPDCRKENIVLTVGRLINSKNHEQLIRIFAEINSISWKLIIVGDDALKQNNRSKLQVLINELGMQDKIIIEGKCKDVDIYYNKARIFAFTSSSEGFPNVIGEAMSACLPVVAYDCVAGPKELILHNKTGYLVKVNDEISFKEYLQKLILSENLRDSLGKAGKFRIQEFSVDRIGQKFVNAILSESNSN